jgi:hypothetical protein
MQRIIKMPDQILRIIIPENKGCFWVGDIVFESEKISPIKNRLTCFIKINSLKMHRKYLRA